MLEIALLQLESQGLDLERAATVGLAAVDEAARRGADIALFPEMWQIGYDACPSSGPLRDQWLARAVDTSDEFVERFRSRARELGLAVVITYLQRAAGLPRNVATVFDARGVEILTYAKLHTCDFGMEAAVSPGDRVDVATLETSSGPVEVGVMICYDREFPEVARMLMLKGAELVLTPNAAFLSEDRLGQLRARAFENMMAVALANYASPADGPTADPQGYNGHSVVYGGVCFDPDGVPLDQTVVLADESPGVVMASLDLEALRTYRAREVWGDAYRRPHLYGPLLVDDVMPVFGRSDARRSTRSETTV